MGNRLIGEQTRKSKPVMRISGSVDLLALAVKIRKQGVETFLLPVLMFLHLIGHGLMVDTTCFHRNSQIIFYSDRSMTEYIVII